MEFLIDLFTDSFFDTLRLVPFLFLTYLFLEWIEKQNTGKKMEQFLKRHQKIAPFAGSLFGLFPECGFSTAASNLYTTKVISAGTLIAIFLSTSDEMLPLMISKQASFNTILPILIVKVIVACIAGYIVEIFCAHLPTNVEEFCEREHCDCEDENLFQAAFEHTKRIVIWLFIVILIMNGIVELIGEQQIQSLISQYPTFSMAISVFVGMIPSCASSIILSTMYLEHTISFATVCAGLLANAGVGMMVLFRVNPNLKNNLTIVSYVWMISFVAGLILEIVF